MKGKQTFCPSRTGNITNRTVASPVCNLQTPQPKANTSEQLGGTDTYRGPYKSEFADKCDADEHLYVCEPTVILYSQYSNYAAMHN